MTRRWCCSLCAGVLEGIDVFSIGLTGGIGSGKSAVADLLVERGAWLIDADEVAREVVEPGGPAYQPLLERFGHDIVGDDGLILRQVLADRVFGDEHELEALNAITHPAIGIEMIERQKALADTSALVILAIPLLRPIHRESMQIDEVVVVDCDETIAVDRLVTFRGFPLADAQSRIAAQIGREERRSQADYVLLNEGDIGELELAVRELWDWIAQRRCHN